MSHVRFAIVCVSEPDRPLEFFTTGKEAGEHAKSFNAFNKARGFETRYRVLRIEQEDADTAWRTREHNRFLSGDYKPVPWAGEAFAIVEHFAHVSQDDPAKLAYTPDNAHGIQDKQLRVRPGRYLEKFYANTLTQDQRREWCAKWDLENNPSELLFADTPDEIEHVYTHGPNSCMAHGANDYNSPCHPTRVYGAGDLAIAYMERDERGTARVICWPSKKIYGRMYGDADRLSLLLSEAGYSRSTNQSDWDKARLLRIECDDGDRLVAPYLDYPNVNLADDGDYLIIDSGGDIEAQRTDGTCRCSPEYSCERCGDGIDYEDDMFSVGEEQWCRHCYENHTFYCEHCEETCSGGGYLTTHNGYNICESCAENFSTCEDCEETFHCDDISHAEVLDKTLCSSCASEYVRTPCGELANNEDDCECSECEDHRFALSPEGFELELCQPEAAPPPVEQTIVKQAFHREQLELALVEPFYVLNNAMSNRIASSSPYYPWRERINFQGLETARGLTTLINL